MAQLIFSTMHTTSASGTIDRVVEAFPADQQQQVRVQLSMVLQAVVCQQLVPTVDGGMMPVFEIMTATTAIRNLTREGKTHQIDSIIASSGKLGMRTMDQSLFDLVQAGTITQDTAMRYCAHEDALRHRLELAQK
jgi:twitching motility protein PilT